MLSVPLLAFSLNFLASLCSFLSRATVSVSFPVLSARVHSSADFEVTSAEATPLEKPLAEAVAGRAAAIASRPSRQRARDMGAA